MIESQALAATNHSVALINEAKVAHYARLAEHYQDLGTNLTAWKTQSMTVTIVPSIFSPGFISMRLTFPSGLTLDFSAVIHRMGVLAEPSQGDAVFNVDPSVLKNEPGISYATTNSQGVTHLSWYRDGIYIGMCQFASNQPLGSGGGTFS